MSNTLQSLSALKILCDQIQEAEIRSEERLKAQHGRFNVFTTLLKASDEVRLHTRFIHELLNPEGTHDCGDLFLKLLFDTLQEYQPLDHEDSPSSVLWEGYSKQSYWVGKEVSKKQGQLDLLLESDSNLLVIENKIWAGEQEKQVGRYIEYLESQAPKAGQVLYLTLDGKKAETHNGKAYFRISYRDHIMAWLECCLHATYDIVPINQVLIQYQKVVQQLIGKSADHQTMKTIKDYIRQNPQLIKTHDLVGTAIGELKEDAKQRFADALTKSLSDEYIVVPRPGMIKGGFAKDDNAGLLITPKHDDFTADHPFSIWVEINRWNALCVGIEAKWKQERALTSQETKFLGQMKILVLQECEDQGLHHASVEKTWWGTYWPMSYHDLVSPFLADNDSIADFLDDLSLPQAVKDADAGIRIYIGILKDAYKKSKGTLTE